MAMASVGGIIGLICFLFFILVPIGLLVALQVWLCRKGKWIGLILPGISLALSLLLTLSVAAFSLASGAAVGGGANYLGPDGQEVVAQQGPETEQKLSFSPRTMAAAGVLFLTANIPTVVFGGIWLHCKGRRDTYEDLKRMRIEDLE